MLALFWRKLPDVAHRRFDRRVVPKFGTRLLLFFITFFIGFGAYIMSFVTGTEWGVGYGHWCLGISEAMTGRLAELLDRVPVPILHKVGSGFVRLASNDMAAVILTSFLAAVGVVAVVSMASALVSVIRLFMGHDGSQAEVYDGSKKIEGVHSEAQERRRRTSWRPDVSHNPYSVRKA